MRILVYSDSHNNESAVKKIKDIIDKFDAVLFLGDGETDFKEIVKNYSKQAYSVLGNCDYSSEYPYERVVEFDGINIFMCHGHKYNVKMTLNSIRYKGEEVGADIVLFGHSHTQILEKDDYIYLMNPGSVSHSYGLSKTGYGVIEIDSGVIKDIYLRNF